MISLGDIVMAVIDLVIEGLWAIWPWHGDKKKDKE